MTLSIIKSQFGNKPIQHIKKREYQIFLNEYGAKFSKASAKKLNGHIRTCVREAIEEGVIQSDFTNKIIVTGKNEKFQEEKHLHYDESKQLLKEINANLHQGKVYYILLLGLTTGMRFGEIIGLKREDFNFFKSTISINKTWGYLTRMHNGFGPTKNEKSNRVIRVAKHVMQAFKKLFKETPENIHQLVFFSSSSKYKVISNSYANKVLRKLLNSLSIENLITMHGLRHTHASVLLYKKVSLLYVAERLGHTDTEMTSKTYAHILKELRQEDEEKTVEIFEVMAS
ncbi:tyrosine-type recombinase/integrase [Alkalicoccobacillus murimartini]|uniref:Integrase n=1 Tax=Alkalicoccobacillus murimartini TaxID=171685 RepID=A0ABT9YE14_9BACI|nr:site-specific integrase [Alkalicoccobacillus murimartini]MDQ0206091.1 integrase [Alkalicoccobacillus murimartini]